MNRARREADENKVQLEDTQRESKRIQQAGEIELEKVTIITDTHYTRPDTL